ncbi:MAG TPA: nitrate reductase molybdenum cofactor assembly chaperone [Propionibacteriaceae bacterium]|nr:nitrate reductase molybdenum cofactor assembly chaperone [Propionibacteriaceae bacterium]
MSRWLGTPTRRAGWPAPTLAEPDLRTAWQAISLLLDYPGDELLGVLPVLRDAVSPLPPPVGQPLVRLVDELAATDVVRLRSDYVATFDTTRRCALHLTYYSYGDTRKRGIALVQFKQAYRRGGLEVTEDELPDHLSVVLEFGATADVGIAWKLLNDHRVGVELLRLALADRGSRWHAAVEALAATLPTLRGDQEQAIATLLAEGPPNEDVGLDAYSLDPRLNPHPDADEALLEGVNR